MQKDEFYAMLVWLRDAATMFPPEQMLCGRYARTALTEAADDLGRMLQVAAEWKAFRDRLPADVLERLLPEEKRP